jgi:anaerobic magnesium-protoporphyrin IX monomethyl ester cyclase
MARSIDALFISYYANVDRWHDDAYDDRPSLARTRGVLSALSDDVWMKDEVDVVVDGNLYDFSRFLSWVQYGTTAEHARFDPFNMTLLAGTYYLNLLHESELEIRVANVADRRTLEEFGAAYTPRFVLLSTTLLFDAADRDIVPTAVRQIRAQWPDAVIVLGGLMLVSYEKNMAPAYFHRMLQSYGADAYVVSPRGEGPLLEILRRGSLDALLATPDIPMTYLVSNGTVISPPDALEVGPGMSDHPLRWSRLPQTEHFYHTVHVRTARSCAFACAFCEYPINQGPLTLAPLDVFEAELRELKKMGHVKGVVFTDDTFNVPLRRFKQLLPILAKYDLEWYSFFRPQYADEDTARLMKEAGCRAVFCGLESVDDTVLKNMNKNAKVDDYKRGIDQLKKHDIGVHANFIVGFPGETEQSAKKIVPFIDGLGIEFCTVCTWSYIPSTPIGKRADEFGIRGLGVQWTHDTMDSATAQDLARHVATEQKSAVHNAVRGEAWTEFLFYANGFTVDEVQLAVRTFNTYLGRDASAGEIRSSANYAALKSVLERRDMPAPRLGLD